MISCHSQTERSDHHKKQQKHIVKPCGVQKYIRRLFFHLFRFQPQGSHIVQTHHNLDRKCHQQYKKCDKKPCASFLHILHHHLSKRDL